MKRLFLDHTVGMSFYEKSGRWLQALWGAFCIAAVLLALCQLLQISEDLWNHPWSSIAATFARQAEEIGALFHCLCFAVSSVTGESRQVRVVERPELRPVYCFVYRCYEQRTGIGVADPVGAGSRAVQRQSRGEARAIAAARDDAGAWRSLGCCARLL